MKRIRLVAACILLLPAMILQGRFGNDHGLSPNKPIMLTLWHHYSGLQKQAFDELMDEFNETQGKKQGISVDAITKGGISNISVDLKSSLEKKANTPRLPSIFTAYGDTAENVERTEKLASINSYISDEEMAEYVDGYMKSDSLHDHAYVNTFPVTKATKVVVINKSIWDEFVKKENVKLSDLDTREGLARISKEHYTCSGGKAFFVKDVPVNCLNAGSGQLGTLLFSVTGHTGSFTVSRETMHKLWDQYYVPFIKGYYTKNGRLASDDIKTKNIIACVSSPAGTTLFPKEVVRDDGTGCAVEYTVRGVPNFRGKKSYAVTQGVGVIVSKSDEAHEYTSIQFLKWFTEKERDTLFSAGSSYLPVRKEVDPFVSRNAITEAEKVTINQLVRDTVRTSTETASASTLTSQKSFNGSYEIRNYLETVLNEKCVANTCQIQQAAKNKDSCRKAWKPYLSNENSNAWFEQITKDINEKMKDSDT